MTGLAQVQVDTGSPVPPYEQVRLQLAEMIAAGVLAPGDRLPPLRQLASDLGLAVGTVGRAYRELEQAGLVHSRRGAGTRVASATPLARSQRGRRLREHAAAYVQQARRLGADDRELLQAVRHALGG